MSLHPKSEIKTIKPVFAAGGILYRRDEDGTIKIALIHRPYYDDWSLPKGKLEKNETILAAAWREIKEETGYNLAIRGYLGKIVYHVPLKHSSIKNSRKTSPVGMKKKYVYYWAAEVLGGEFIPNNEVDEITWVSCEDATPLLTYRLDNKVLENFSTFPTHAHNLAIIRHAKAGDPLKYKGNDQLRPLDKEGKAQARAIANWLTAIAAQPLFSADKVRCIDTLRPYSDMHRIPITINQDFDEEFCYSNPEAAYAAFQETAEKNTGFFTPVISSQGGVIPSVLENWSNSSGYTTADITARKGSLWLISHYEGRIVRAHYCANPLDYPLGVS